MPLHEAIAKRIIELCKQRGYTINAMTYKAGIPSSTVKNIIYGKSLNPGIGTLKIVCDTLGVSLSEFFASALLNDVFYDN